MITLLTIANLSLAFGRVNRATFHPDGIRPESDTDHSFMLVLLALDIAARHPELGLDHGRLAILGTVHDLPEVHAGDTNTAGGLNADQKAGKAAREAAAVARLHEEMPGSAIVDWLDTYERQACPESKFLRYLDKITPKLTHALNGNAAIRAMGHDAEWLQARHREQGAELAALYPEFVGVLGPLFDAACAESERVLALVPALTNCDGCANEREEEGGTFGCVVNVPPDIADAVTVWSKANCDRRTWKCNPGATGCPGFAARAPQ